MGRTRLSGKPEEAAKAALEHGRLITEHDVEQVLSLINIPQGRRFKENAHSPSVRGMVLGLYVWGDKVEITNATKEFPNSTRLFAKYAQQERPGFLFTSIQVNVNNKCPPHVDGGNLGASLITGIGDYKRGELFVEHPAGDQKLRIQENIRASSYTKGMVVKGWDVQVGTRTGSRQPGSPYRVRLVNETGRVVEHRG